MKMRHRVFLYFLIVGFVFCIMGGSVLSTYRQFVAEGPLSESKEIVIRTGHSLRKIAKHLYREGVVRSPSIFEIGARASGQATSIKAGEYSIPARASAKTVLTVLTSGNTFIRRLVVPEGLTSYQIMNLMDGMYGLVGEVSKEPKNGSLLPDTYYYSYGDTKEDLILRMKNGMERTLAELWTNRSKAVTLKNPQEAVVMASIIEKETSRDSERAHIASVFYNRLAKKMKIQSDPTVIFAITDGKGDLKRPLTYQDLKIDNPYNTYVISGLPKYPISNPGYASLKAVLNPDKTDDLYFVADGKGGHVFSQTYKEHERNVQNYREQRRNKNNSQSQTNSKK